MKEKQHEWTDDGLLLEMVGAVAASKKMMMKKQKLMAPLVEG